MTVIVTRNVEGRVRGFLASVMLEIASGVYTSANLNVAVRERIWDVLKDWKVGSRDDQVTMVWEDRDFPGGQAVKLLGKEEGSELWQGDGLVLTRRELTLEGIRSLTVWEQDVADG